MLNNTSIYRNRNKSGQSLVEFALAIPFILLIIVAITYFGRVFYVKQTVSLATQEGVRSISRLPNLSDPSVREFAVGFTTNGQLVNPNSTVAQALGSARLLSNQTTGNLPPGSIVRVLPWDSAGAVEDNIPAGTIAIRIEYPFKFLGNPFDGSSSEFGDSIDVWTGEGGDPVSFIDFPISERTVAMPELYQQF